MSSLDGPVLRRRVALGLAIIHLALVSGYALQASLSPRVRPSEEKATSMAFSLLKLYTLYTAFHADYGFFSPGIGSSHDMEIEIVMPDGQVRPFRLDPANREVEVRFHTLLLIFGRDRLYQELMARSMASSAYKIHPEAVRVIVSVYRLQFPTMKEWREGKPLERMLLFRSVYKTPASGTAES